MTESTFRAECGCAVTASSDAWNITSLIARDTSDWMGMEEFARRFPRIKEDPFQVALGIHEGWSACWALHHHEPALGDCGKAYEEWLRTESVADFPGRYQAFRTGWMAARKRGES